MTINITTVYKSELANYTSLIEFVDTVRTATAVIPRISTEFIDSSSLVLSELSEEDATHYSLTFMQEWVSEDEITNYNARKNEESINDSQLETDLNMVITHTRL